MSLLLILTLILILILTLILILILILIFLKRHQILLHIFLWKSGLLKCHASLHDPERVDFKQLPLKGVHQHKVKRPRMLS